MTIFSPFTLEGFLSAAKTGVATLQRNPITKLQVAAYFIRNLTSNVNEVVAHCAEARSKTGMTKPKVILGQPLSSYRLRPIRLCEIPHKRTGKGEQLRKLVRSRPHSFLQDMTPAGTVRLQPKTEKAAFELYR